MLSHARGVEVTDDPYSLDPSLLPELDDRRQRSLVKLLVLMAFNAKDTQSACSAFRQDQPTGSPEKSMKNDELLKVLDAFVAKSPHLEEDLCSDRGIRLMNQDSQVAAEVIRIMTNLGIPVLCIHDSFVVDYNHAVQLRAAMMLACHRVLGRDVKQARNYMGKDQVERETPDLLSDYIDFREIDRSPGYQARKRRFEERRIYLDG
jgi:hypothetical protein